MRNNPEFIRNKWLEFTPHRVVAMPLVLGAFFVLIFVLNEYKLNDSTASFALFLTAIFAFLWGTRMASESVIAEVRDRTWDSQRMSAIGPWEMTWAKLLGSTLFTWYGSLICLSIYTVSSEQGPFQRLKIILLLVIGGLFSQSVGLLSSLHAIKKNRRYDNSQVSAFMILGLLMIGPFISMALSSDFLVSWYGLKFENKDFILLSLATFLGWSIYGCYRLMRSELQVRNQPWGWLLFVFFISGYIAGFPDNDLKSIPVSSRFLTAFFVSVSATYLMVFSEKKDPIRYRKILLSYKEKNWKSFFENIDCWMITFVAVLFFMTAFMTSSSLTASPLFSEVNPGQGDVISHNKLFVFAFFLFLVRDVIILLYMNLSPNSKRADMAAVLYLGLLYGVFPAILSNIDLTSATVFFWPRYDEYALYVPLAAALEISAAGWLLKKRWKTIYSS